jgi:hypothetical protein
MPRSFRVFRALTEVRSHVAGLAAELRTLRAERDRAIALGSRLASALRAEIVVSESSKCSIASVRAESHEALSGWTAQFGLDKNEEDQGA